MSTKDLATFLVLAAVSVSAGDQSPATVPAAAPPACPEVATALTALMQNDGRLRDWANLGRYREANRGVAAGDAGSRVVFMGDSITDSWPSRVPEFFAGKPYIGRGISGQTTPQMLIRFRPDVIDLKPRVVVILAGTNDIAGNTGPMTNEEIQGNLASMAQLAKASGIRVVLSSILPVSSYHTPANAVAQTIRRPMSRIQALNNWMKQHAAAEGHVYLDYFSAMVDDKGLLREELSADDLHPNNQGYAVMAPLAEAAILQARR